MSQQSCAAISRRCGLVPQAESGSARALMIQNAACIMIKHMDKSHIQSQLERIAPHLLSQHHPQLPEEISQTPHPNQSIEKGGDCHW